MGACMKKICTKCKIEKPFSEFHKCKGKKFNLTSACKLCRNKHSRDKSAEIGHDVLYRRELEKDPEGYKSKRKEYYKRNAEREKARSKWHREKDPEATKERRKAEYQRNKKRYIDSAVSWNKENKDRRRDILRNYQERNKNNPEYIAIQRARKMVERVLSLTGERKAKRTFEILGYGKEDLVAHIESLFEDGMSWDNKGEWHIDHIVPVSELVSLGVTDPKKINALNNLRPMWASENLSKGDKFELLPPEAEGIFRVEKRK